MQGNQEATQDRSDLAIGTMMAVVSDTRSRQIVMGLTFNLTLYTDTVVPGRAFSKIIAFKRFSSTKSYLMRKTM